MSIDDVIGNEPSPAFALEVAEESDRLLEFLPDPALREIAGLKMEGLGNDEVAERVGCARRTVERRLELIRKLWLAHCESA